MPYLNPELLAEAEHLAAREYSVTALEDTLSNGETVYVLGHPELSGCKSHGKTLEEAAQNLRDATIDYIYFLLEDGLSVPDPLLTTE